MVFWILEMLSYHLFFQQCVPVLLWFPSLAFPPPPGLDAAGFDRSGGFSFSVLAAQEIPHRLFYIAPEALLRASHYARTLYLLVLLASFAPRLEHCWTNSLFFFLFCLESRFLYALLLYSMIVTPECFTVLFFEYCI